MENQAIVIDNGTGTIKAGIAGQDAPRIKFPSMVGKPKMPLIMVGMDQQQSYVGNQAIEKKSVLNLKYPLINGTITNWEDMIKIWEHTYYHELRVTPEDHPCMLTQPPQNPTASRHRMAQIMFESFRVPALYLSIQATLSLYAAGKKTGIVLDSGTGTTNTVPIYEGYALPHAIGKNTFAGKDLTAHMCQLLEENGTKLSLNSEFQVLRDIKEKFCCVAENYEEELKKYEENKTKHPYVLPDGKQIFVSNQGIKCPEVLFDSSIKENSGPTIQEMINSSITKCDPDVRKDLYSNIVLSGGTTMIPGFSNRLKGELGKLVEGEKVSFIEKEDREFLPWIGGSILSSLSTFKMMWITAAEYQQNGPNIVQKKCF